MRGTLLVSVACLALVFALAPGAAGGDRRGHRGRKVWGGLVVATNAQRPVPVPPEMNRLQGTLSRTFGYNQFEVIGQSRRALERGQDSWLAVSKHFSLHVDPRGASGDGYRVNLRLFQDKQLLLETDATLSKSSPLVIKGPQVGAGQLLLLLVVQ